MLAQLLADIYNYYGNPTQFRNLNLLNFFGIGGYSDVYEIQNSLLILSKNLRTFAEGNQTTARAFDGLKQALNDTLDKMRVKKLDPAKIELFKEAILGHCIILANDSADCIALYREIFAAGLDPNATFTENFVVDNNGDIPDEKFRKSLFYTALTRKSPYTFSTLLKKIELFVQNGLQLAKNAEFFLEIFTYWSKYVDNAFGDRLGLAVLTMLIAKVKNNEIDHEDFIQLCDSRDYWNMPILIDYFENYKQEFNKPIQQQTDLPDVLTNLISEYSFFHKPLHVNAMDYHKLHAAHDILKDFLQDIAKERFYSGYVPLSILTGTNYNANIYTFENGRKGEYDYELNAFIKEFEEWGNQVFPIVKYDNHVVFEQFKSYLDKVRIFCTRPVSWTTGNRLEPKWQEFNEQFSLMWNTLSMVHPEEKKPSFIKRLFSGWDFE